MLETAIQAARLAGRILVERWSVERDVQLKGLRDIVTDADLAAEEAVVRTIRARFPDHAMLTEEGGELAGQASYLWVVDPLDGTTNYSRRFPSFSVSVGLVSRGQSVRSAMFPLAPADASPGRDADAKTWSNGQLTLGVVYDPLNDLLFVAQHERGATLNGAPLHVSQVDQVGDTIIGLDWARSQANRREIVARLDRIAPACGTVRGTGSAALGLCYVAAGWTDAYFHVGLKPWDMAAGLLLIREAGGHVTDLEGRPWQPWGERILVSNGHVHQALLDLMDGVSEK